MKSAKQEFQPVLNALEQIQRRLDVKFPAPLIIGAASRQEFLQQELPDHIRVISKKRQGPRVPMRQRRHYYESKRHVAKWPNDQMIEGAISLLACVIAGEADFQIADYAICCRMGDCILLPAGIPRQDGKRPLLEGNINGRHGEILWVYTSIPTDEGLTCWVIRSEDGMDKKQPAAYCRVEHRFLAQLFNGFCMEAMRGQCSDVIPQIQKTMLALLSVEIAHDNVLKDWGRPRYQGESEKNQVITEALAYIEEYLDRRLTADKVARQVFLSPSTFFRLFKQETGKTFVEYQTQRRMEVAEELLKTTDRPIFSVGRRVGLKDGQLRALFHQKHGCSPSEYRKREKMTGIHFTTAQDF